MAVGAIDVGTGANYEARVTPFVVVACMVAATGGLIFGYDIGISGSYLFKYCSKSSIHAFLENHKGITIPDPISYSDVFH